MRFEIACESLDRFLACVAKLDLIIEEQPLKTRPGAWHWHLRSSSPGTVEATLDQGLLVIEVRRNRKTPASESMFEKLRDAFR